MAEGWDELANVLEAEALVYRRLLELLRQERPALQRSRCTEIEGFAAAKHDLIQRLQTEERRRKDLIEGLAGAAGLPVGQVTLSLLIQSAAASKKGRLRRCRDDLVGLVAQVKAENQRNEALYRHAGDLLRTAYGVLKGIGVNGFVYQRGGRMQIARLNGKLVCSEI